MNLPKCNFRNDCLFRDNQSCCHCLNTTYFGFKKCPFAKSKEQEIEELKQCCEAIDYDWESYKAMLKHNEVFDIYIYRVLFGGDN